MFFITVGNKVNNPFDSDFQNGITFNKARRGILWIGEAGRNFGPKINHLATKATKVTHKRIGHNLM